MSDSISFFVPGIPRPGGSKRAHAYINAYGEPRASLRDAGGDKNTNWRAIVAAEACKAMHGRRPLLGPLRVDMIFRMPRPKKHFGTGKKSTVLRADAPTYHTSMPDRLKLSRSTEDAMTKIVWHDDAQGSTGETQKIYCNVGEIPGAQIVVTPLNEPTQKESPRDDGKALF